MDANASLPHLAPGDRLGDYVLRSLLGRRQDAEVYRAYAPHLQRDVTVNLFQFASVPSDEQAARFRAEAQALTALRHSHIAGLYGYGIDGLRVYMVSELVEGPSLRDRLSAHPTGLDRALALRLFREIAGAIAAAHDHGVVHGNITPENIVLHAARGALVTGFIIPALAALTARPGNVVRTSAYAAPELSADVAPTRQTDIYSLGILLYEMVTGELPFKADSPDNARPHQQRAAPIPPGQLQVGLDPRIEKTILTALNQDPDARFVTVRDMLRALQNEEVVVQYETLTLKRDELVTLHRSQLVQFERARLVEPSAPATPVRRMGRASRLAVAGGLLLGLLVLALVGLLM